MLRQKCSCKKPKSKEKNRTKVCDLTKTSKVICWKSLATADLICWE